MALLVPPPLKRVALGSKTKLQGVAFLIVVALLLYLTISIYNKKFIPTTPVSLRTGVIGNQLSLGADVKLRGIIVGDVRQITTNGKTATMKLALDPSKTKEIPANVVARILPKTLFGQKFVDLVLPEKAQQSRPIRKGDVIPEDRSSVGIETEQVLNNLLPFLRTVQPEKLNSTLTAVATALEGRGNELGDNLVRTDDYLKVFNQHLPALQSDITGLANLADTYDQAAPDLLRFLDDSAFTGRTIVEKQRTLAQFFAATTGFANTADTVLTENRDRLIQVAAVSRPTLEELAARAANIPVIADGLVRTSPLLHQVFGTGANKNWLHIYATILGNRGPYTPADCPRYVNRAGSMSGPNCGGGGTAQSGADLGSATALSNLLGSTGASGGTATGSKANPNAAVPLSAKQEDLGIGSVGSPQERAEIASIVQSVSNRQVASSDTSTEVADVLLGPLMRGTQVSFS